MRIKTEASTLVFNGIGYTLIALFSLVCLLPFWLMVSGSFTSEMEIFQEGFNLLPKLVSFDAYKVIFTTPGQILNAYAVTIGITAVGSAFGLFFVSMAGYVLSRKDFGLRNVLSFYIYFTTLFGGGLIPWYILMTKYLDLKDSYWAMILPLMISAWNVILMKNFMKSIPDSIIESAKIDGAGDFLIYAKLIIPLSTPGLATIGLFIALSYWNDWFNATVFIDSPDKYPLQFLLYKILADAEVLRSHIVGNLSVSSVQAPSESLKMAVAVVATGPIIFLYPFLQKYFVKGLTVGAVKG